MEGVKKRTGEGLVTGFCACRGGASFAHVSCLAEQAKLLMEEAEENNLDGKARNARFLRWYSCSLCEQEYYGVVYRALGWAFLADFKVSTGAVLPVRARLVPRAKAAASRTNFDISHVRLAALKARRRGARTTHKTRC